MQRLIDNFMKSIGSKLIVLVGLVLLVSIVTWAYFNISYQKQKMMENIINGTDRLTTTIRLGTHYAMMLNSRDDINQIINNISRLSDIVNIRIYNKEGVIKYSNSRDEVDKETNIKAEACYICHRNDPPLEKVSLEERTRIIATPAGNRLLGIISPICNEPGCATDCHVHPEGKQILGALDVVVSLGATDKEIVKAEHGIIVLAVFVFLVPSAIIFIFVMEFINNPISRLIEGTRRIASGDYSTPVELERADEMGQMADAINQMRQAIGEKQKEINRQKDEYQNLFELVPCIITVQTRDYRLINYNRMFADMFKPDAGDYCYHAYKGLDHKCPVCPVEKTFQDGHSHYSEEAGVNKDGTVKHWVARSSPIRDENGEIVAAMEINLDISERKQLEVELEKSEKKYHAIFNNIPNPVFVLDTKSYEILDCNMSAEAVYGFPSQELVGRSFLEMFIQEEKADYFDRLESEKVLNQVKHIHKDGHTIFVNIRISPSEYSGRKVLLVTTSDITKRLEAEQQLIQASKMATLGEMATGVAHELNQPLSVIKTVSTLFIRKINKEESIEETLLNRMLVKVDKNVDRAVKIINHMRQFARKSDLKLEKVRVPDVIASAFEIFSQQLKVRGIQVEWDLDENVPPISADPGRLEQVFINMLVNARDAIEDKWAKFGAPHQEDDRIVLSLKLEGKSVVCRVCDTGVGVPEAIANKIFEPFFTTKEVGKGTGLGLSISYGIVKECGGTIKAVQNKPEGVCFVLTFPPYGENDANDGTA